MFAGGLILGLTLIALALWLQRHERRGWGSEVHDSKIDRDYRNHRLRKRRRIHVLLLLCGGLILLATFAGPEARWVWIASWLVVCLLLLAIMVLAALDAVGTQRYHAKKLPEIHRRIFGDD